jgi:putative effector of murein hydrolase
MLTPPEHLILPLVFSYWGYCDFMESLTYMYEKYTDKTENVQKFLEPKAVPFYVREKTIWV